MFPDLAVVIYPSAVTWFWHLDTVLDTVCSGRTRFEPKGQGYASGHGCQKRNEIVGQWVGHLDRNRTETVSNHFIKTESMAVMGSLKLLEAV